MRKPIVIESRLAPRRFCVNLFGTLWVRDRGMINARLLNHELIHTAQMRELLFLPFYIIYVIEWVGRLICLRNFDAAYRAISFEREAYANDHKSDYLSVRSHYAQWRGDEDSMQ